jgi:hypothetical protein
MLVEFASAVDAMTCAMAVQENAISHWLSRQIMDLIQTGEDASENDTRKDTAHG